MRRVALLLAVLGSISVSAATGAGPDAEFPSRLVDRSFLCTPRLIAGSRDLDIRVAYPHTVSKSPYQGVTVTPAHYPGYVSAHTGPLGASSQLVYVVSRSAGRSLTADFLERAGAYANGRRCAPSRRSLPLTSKGLSGPPARWSTDASCELQERVVVRLRARLQSPATWGRLGSSLVGARRNVVAASVAIRGEKSGRPIAYFQVDRAGKTALWSASSCR